ncbi:MAG: sugar ABC transporter ATP-binding protein [Bacillota bacterium]
MEKNSLLSVKNVSKDFGPTRVLFNIDFDLRKGEVHAVIGENGAGKSTLMKIISGFHQPEEGSITYKGEEVKFNSIVEGENQGIVMIHQELNLAEDLTVEENVFLGREKKFRFLLNEKKMREDTEEILTRLNCNISPEEIIKNLSISNKQMVEIAKAIRKEASIIIMDEPTSALTGDEVKVLFEMIRNLKKQGVGIIFVSHKLEEIKEIADRVTILRDGYLIKTSAVEDLSEKEMANLMVGRDLEEEMYPAKNNLPKKEEVLRVENLTIPDYVNSASFQLYKGEILGFAGLVGSGRTELWEGIVGLREKRGNIYLQKNKVNIKNYFEAVKIGIAYLTEDRKDKALLTEKSLLINLTLMSLNNYCNPLIDEDKELLALERVIKEFEIQVPDKNSTVHELSGGNQQKLAVAKIMEVDPDIIIFDEPTRGIDVGTKRQIYYFIKGLADEGKTCVVISSELQEIIGLSQRVVVMHEGDITGIIEEEDKINEEEIMQYATGIKGVV